MTLSLKTATPEQINSAVAEHVAGLEVGFGEVLTLEPNPKTGEPDIVFHRPISPYSTSADAVRRMHRLTPRPRRRD